MGLPTFYWYPDTTGTLQKTALTRTVSTIDLRPTRQRMAPKAGDGSPRPAAWDAGMRVRITRERGVTAAQVREFMALEVHLKLGRPVGFTLDTAKSWAAWYVLYKMERGLSSVFTGGNAFSAWEGSAALASGNELAIESANPEGLYEERAMSSINSSNDITLSETMLYTRTLGGLVRHKHFFPALRLPDDQMDRPILTSEHGLTWTLDLELETDPAILSAGYDDYYGTEPITHVLAGSTDLAVHGKLTLGGLLGRGAPVYDDVDPTWPPIRPLS